MNYCKYPILVIVASLVCSSLCLAQTYRIDGFAGYPFGTAAEIIRKDFPVRKKGARFVQFANGEMLFSGGNHFVFPVSQWKFEFFDNKLSQVEIIYTPAENKKEKDRMVSALEKAINKQYFQSKATMRNDGGSYFWIEANEKEEVTRIISLDYGFDSLNVTLAFTDELLHVQAMRASE